MKYSRTYQFSAVLLALLVLFSSVSFSVEEHLCQDTTGSTLFAVASYNPYAQDYGSCHDEQLAASCCSDEIYDACNCCNNSNDYIPSIRIEQQAKEELKLKILAVVKQFTSSSWHFTRVQALIDNHYTYKSPQSYFSITILFQVFRI